MIRTTSARSALKPSETQSLFKFLLHFHPDSDEFRRKGGKPWLWYSYDYASERDAFLPGLGRDERAFWTLLLRRLWKYEDLYLFFRDCYPVWEDVGGGKTHLAMQFSRARSGEIAALSTKYSDYLARQMEQLGVESYTLRHQHHAHAPGHSPRRTEKDYYGIYAFEHNPQVALWLTTGALLHVKVYDHRCYHAENEYGLIVPPEQRAAFGASRATPPSAVVATPTTPISEPMRSAARDDSTRLKGGFSMSQLTEGYLNHLKPEPA
jgi:hypothetical protein